MKTCAFLTLGCRVNQYETEAIREKLLSNGFVEVPFQEKSDVYFINTCAVTGESARKSRQMIRRALRFKEDDPSVIVCAAGCFTQGEWQKPDELLSRVDLLFGNTKKGQIADEILRLFQSRNSADKFFLSDVAAEKEYESLSVSNSINARAFLKIEDGCNAFCSYCFVPFVRGRVRSRRAEDILEEAKRLSENGYREIVLTGIETGAYGEEEGGKENLASLSLAIAKIPNLKRIRFGSLKPTVFTEDFCAMLSAEPKIMPHFHLSLQSGSTKVLSHMRRRYDRKTEEEVIRRIYSYFPDAGLSADLIVGFPGETDEEYLETEDLVRRASLLHTHVFPFSPRKGTAAASFPDQIPDAIKKERAARLLEASRAVSLQFAAKRDGALYRVLCEKIENGEMTGYTENFIHTRTAAPSDLAVGDIIPIRLTKDASFSVETMTVRCKMASDC